MNGWIKIHRKLTEWEWYDDPNVFRLFIHLLLIANHKDKSYRGNKLKAGTVLTGRELLAEQTGLSVRQVRTALKKLQATNEVTIKTSRQGSVIQIVKYKQYQYSDQENDQQATSNNNNTIPSKQEFINYALEKKSNLCKESVGLKFESWVANDWKDGNDKEIKNWKRKLINTIPYLKTINNQIQQPKNLKDLYQ